MQALGWGSPVERFAWAAVEFSGDYGRLLGAVRGEVGPLGKYCRSDLRRHDQEVETPSKGCPVAGAWRLAAYWSSLMTLVGCGGVRA
jgi:hypothetical protein